MLRNAALLLAAQTAFVWAQQTPALPKTEFLLQLRAELEEPQIVGDTPVGGRRVFYVKSGTFGGPRVRGEVLPGGGD